MGDMAAKLGRSPARWEVIRIYAIQNIKTGEFVFGTNFSYEPGENQQRTSLEQMLTYSDLRYAKIDFIFRECGEDYRIVRLRVPEVERVIGFDTPDGYYFYVWEEAPDQ